MGKFIYLVQGQARYIQNYLDLKLRNDVDAILLTYDKQIEGAIFYPDSTWGEGRNYLLSKALESGKQYQYYIFLDDDVKFLKGDYSLFEMQLAKYKPAIAVPVFDPKTRATIIGFKNWFNKRFISMGVYQICRFADAQFMAFHSDVIHDKLVVPLQTHFDAISWYATSSTQQLLMFNLYKKSILQFNNIIVKNDCHRDYTKHAFKELQNNWFKQQFNKPIFDPRPLAKLTKNFFSWEMVFDIVNRSIKTRSFSMIDYYLRTLFYTFLYRPKKRYKIPKKKLIKILRKDSILLSQKLTDFRKN